MMYFAKLRPFRLIQLDKLRTIRFGKKMHAFLNSEGASYLGSSLLLSAIKGKFCALFTTGESSTLTRQLMMA